MLSCKESRCFPSAKSFARSRRISDGANDSLSHWERADTERSEVPGEGRRPELARVLPSPRVRFAHVGPLPEGEGFDAPFHIFHAFLLQDRKHTERKLKSHRRNSMNTNENSSTDNRPLWQK